MCLFVVLLLVALLAGLLLWPMSCREYSSETGCLERIVFSYSVRVCAMSAN
jgi:hypothetical protein